MLFSAAVIAASVAAQPDLEQPPPLTHTLPAEWHGVWSGSLQSVGADTLTTMHLEVAPLDEQPGATWRITYGDGRNASVRDYRMIPGAAADRFYIDENNGILIDTRLAGDTLHSAFMMAESLAFATYRLHEETIEFEISIFSTVGPRETTAGDEPNQVTVTSYHPMALQRATLQRAPLREE